MGRPEVPDERESELVEGEEQLHCLGHTHHVLLL